MAYRVHSEVWEGNEPAWQQVLAQAYRARERPVCLCVEPGQEVCLALVAGHYIARRLPGTGARHSSSCAHYEPPLSISGEGLLSGQAIVEDDLGRVTLKLDFPLAKFAGRAPPAAKEQPAETARADSRRLTMRGLLHYLWKEADFHRWTPGMAGKRSYGTFYKYLQRAAAGKTAGHQPLSDLLVIPPPGEGACSNRAGQGAEMYLRITRATAAPGGGRRLGLVLGEVYSLEPEGVTPRIKLKCMLERPLAVPPDLYERLLRRFAAQLAMWQPGDDRLVLLGSFYCDDVGVPVLQEIVLMNVTRDWLPFETLFERELVTYLVGGGRRFYKTLRFNLHSQVPMASAVLGDCGSPAVALFVEVPSDDPPALAASIAQAGESGLKTWCWRPGEALLEQAQIPAIWQQSAGERSLP